MAVERYGSKTDVIVKLVLVFFVALLSFSIGIFVGKKFSDNQHKLAQLEPTENHSLVSQNTPPKERQQTQSVSADAIINEALSDDEIARLAEEFVSDDEEETYQPTRAVAAVPQENVRLEKDTTQQAIPQQPMGAAQAMAKGETLQPHRATTTQAAKPTHLPNQVVHSAVGKFTVQVASYAEEREAQARAAELKGQGYESFYVRANVKGKIWYRVSVGLFSTQREAVQYKDDLMAKTNVNSAIVQRISE